MELEIKEYCHECEDFKPIVVGGRFFCENIEYMTADRKVRCENKGRCEYVEKRVRLMCDDEKPKVAQGRWEIDDRHGGTISYCSVCRFPPDFDPFGKAHLSLYCPNCGAYMETKGDGANRECRG